MSNQDLKKIARLPMPSSTPVIHEYTGAAAGFGALKSTIKELTKHSGIVEGSKLLLRMNQEGGFDCPGCAWPEPQKRSTFEFCENGAKAVAAEATKKRVTPDFFARWSVEALRAQSDYWLEAQGRLTHPMWLPAGGTHYQAIEWDELFKRLGNTLSTLDHPNRAIFYTSGRTSNEAAFLYQLFARQLGTNNLPDCSNMCHESSGRGLGETIGIGKGTVQLDDFEHADCILVIGQNPGTNHPRMLTALEDAAQRGCKIITINPLRERGLERFAHPQRPLALLGQSTAISSHYLQVKINGDIAALQGIMKCLIERDSKIPTLDHSFIKEHTTGFTALKEHLSSLKWTEIEAGSGLTRSELSEVADVYAKSSASIVCWAMGLTQHENGVDNIKEVVNLLLLKGNIGKRGAGACPVRGHSNVQGDRTVGIVERPSVTLLKAIEERFQFQPPKEHGYDVVSAIHAMNQGQVDVFFAMGGNFLSATPDTDYTASGLQQCAITAHVSTKLNRSHLITGKEAFILPCLGRTELDIQESGPQFVTVENSMSVVSRSMGKRTPASSHLLSEPAIVSRLAQTTFGEKVDLPDWAKYETNYSFIRSDIEAVIPGFSDYERRSEKSFILPNGPRERRWTLEGSKARFTIQQIPHHVLEPDQLLMMTLRSHDQYNTTIYGWDDRYRGIYGSRHILMMHPDDITARGFNDGDIVQITSHFEEETRVVNGFSLVAQSIPRGCAASYFPEANPLIPARKVARGSNTPSSKSVVISIQADC